MLSHPVEEVQATAREEYKKYIDDVMSSEFSKHGLEVIHNCGQKATTQQSNEVAEINEDMEHSHACDNIAKKSDELFYDYIEGHPNEAQQLQRIRNTRSKHQKSTICGQILTCFEC